MQVTPKCREGTSRAQGRPGGVWVGQGRSQDRQGTRSPGWGLSPCTWHGARGEVFGVRAPDQYPTSSFIDSLFSGCQEDRGC